MLSLFAEQIAGPNWLHEYLEKVYLYTVYLKINEVFNSIVFIKLFIPLIPTCSNIFFETETNSYILASTCFRLFD
jgi:hypothetical protein